MALSTAPADAACEKCGAAVSFSLPSTLAYAAEVVALIAFPFTDHRGQRSPFGVVAYVADVMRRLENDDGAQDFAPLHLVERLLDLVERDRLGHELVEREAALEVELDERREVARRQAVAVPTRLQRAAASEEVDHRDVGEGHVGCRHADLHHGAGEVAA